VNIWRLRVLRKGVSRLKRMIKRTKTKELKRKRDKRRKIKKDKKERLKSKLK